MRLSKESDIECKIIRELQNNQFSYFKHIIDLEFEKIEKVAFDIYMTVSDYQGNCTSIVSLVKSI